MTYNICRKSNPSLRNIIENEGVPPWGRGELLISSRLGQVQWYRSNDQVFQEYCVPIFSSGVEVELQYCRDDLRLSLSGPEHGLCQGAQLPQRTQTRAVRRPESTEVSVHSFESLPPASCTKRTFQTGCLNLKAHQRLSSDAVSPALRFSDQDMTVSSKLICTDWFDPLE